VTPGKSGGGGVYPSGGAAGGEFWDGGAAEREKGRERGGTDRWAATQCQASVPLTGGFDLSADRGQSGARRADARGPAREGTEVGRLDE
jgi:hypothetical protein